MGHLAWSRLFGLSRVSMANATEHHVCSRVCQDVQKEGSVQGPQSDNVRTQRARHGVPLLAISRQQEPNLEVKVFCTRSMLKSCLEWR